jgi:hypothetical protein
MRRSASAGKGDRIGVRLADTWLGLAAASQGEFEQIMGNGFVTDGIGPAHEGPARSAGAPPYIWAG